MLNIHSFLPGKKNQGKGNGQLKHKPWVMFLSYMLVAAILILSSDNLIGKGRVVALAYNDKGTEETAIAADIQTVNSNDTVIKELVEQTSLVRYTNKVAVNKISEMEEEQEQELKKAQAKKAKEEKEKAKKAKAEKARAEKAKETISNKGITLSSEQKDVLLRIVEAEATGEDEKGRILVANVVLNRVNSDKFPDTVKEVVFQKSGKSHQFSPTKDGRFWSVKVSSKTRNAVERALNGEDYSQGALYFVARSKASSKNVTWFDRHLTRLFKYGGHEFYK